MKYPENFEGWLPLGMILGGKYLVLEKPDHKYQALIHLEGGAVCEVREMKSGESIYEHPTFNGIAKTLLVLMQMDTWMYQNYQKI
jgi:hypothetical protein